MSISNAEKRQKLMGEYLKTLGVEVDNRNIIIRYNDFIFQFHMFQTNIEVSLPACFACLLDCNKFLEFYLAEAPPEADNLAHLEREDLLLLTQIKNIADDKLPLESEVLQAKLRTKIQVLHFGLIGFDQVGKSTLFEMVPGKPRKVAELLNTYVKEITSFAPLKIKIYDYGSQIMENLTSPSPAPLLLEKLKNFYLYIIVTDSSSQNIMALKNQILPKLKKISPYAAIVVIANKQDLPNRLSAPLVEKILSHRTYPLTAINPESKDFFNKMLNEIILLRLDQMREYNCPFLLNEKKEL